MEPRKRKFLIALFYPFTLVMLVAGFLAFLLLLLGFSPLLAGTAALCFFAISASVLYFITKPAVRTLGVQKICLGLVITADLFAILSIAALLVTSSSP